MASITFIEADGAIHVVDVASEISVMEAARDNDIRGILADCGGSCACGTCRIYLDPEWTQRVGPASEIEEATLEGHEQPRPGLRLSCQVMVTEMLDGLVVRLPASQF